MAQCCVLTKEDLEGILLKSILYENTEGFFGLKHFLNSAHPKNQVTNKQTILFVVVMFGMFWKLLYLFKKKNI